MDKPKITVICSSYPYGSQETFLDNEINFLCQFYTIHVIPIIKKEEKDKPRDLPDNVSFSQPLVPRGIYSRVIKGLFNNSPILPYLSDLIFLFRRSKNLRNSLKEWFLYFLVYRIVQSHEEFEEIFENNSNLVYFYWCNFPLAFLNTNKEVFVRVHGGEVDLERHFGYIPMLKYKILDHANFHYLAISESSQKNLLNIKGVKSLINRLGVFETPKSRILETSVIRIVSCSNVIALKRVHLILEAVLRVSVDLEWIHFGDGPLLKEVIQKAKGPKPHLNIKFLGRVDNAEIIRFYSNNFVDLFINVSETEGVPVSIMEAFSFGIPCFATDVGGISEIVDERVGKLVSKDFNINELVSFITNIKEISNQRNFRENAKTRWRKKCNAAENYLQLHHCFNAIIGGN